ncbi:MAG: DNA primase small subunit PriS [Thermoplasmata archaeon]|nr:DNA primase small subunit PriS [Thermoplasmata archaeon]
MKGGETPRKTIDFIKGRFKDYYDEVELYLPERFGRREFGFMFFDADYVQRHMNFATKNEIKQYLVNRMPAHVYHSAAYYSKPGAPTMVRKDWLGADLIFDLDADHVIGARKMTYEQMLGVVKTETMKLIDDFLVGDFGFEERDLVVTFSGGRGYHIHIRDPRVWTLSSHERREIVDYILGTDMDEEAIFVKSPFDRTPYGLKYKFEMPAVDEVGWRGRIARGIVEEVELLKEMGKGEALARLKGFEGVGHSTAKELYDILFEGENGKTGYDYIKQGNLDIFPGDRYLNRFKKGFLSIVMDTRSGKTDEPVTSDVKRLIRLPTSLHGKTGFRVVLLSRSELDDFDPLVEAVPATWSDDEVVLKGRSKASVNLKGETFNLEDDIIRLPEYAAMFFMCRGMATLA